MRRLKKPYAFEKNAFFPEECPWYGQFSGGDEGIRTLETVSRLLP